MTLISLADRLNTPLVSESFDDVDIRDFTIYGFKSKADGRASEIHNLITGAEIVRTIDGAPTLNVTVHDSGRLLSQANFLSYRITMVLDTYAYELAQVKKQGDDFTLVFEDVLVAEMRRRQTARKVPARAMSRVEFGYLLLSELPPVDFVTPPIDLSVTNNELARGKDKPTPGEVPEDTWKALTRIFGEVKWRFWVDKGKVFAAPDNYLITLPSAGTIQENVGGVDWIDYDIDSGKKIDKATVSVVSDRWSLPIGAVVGVDSPGPDQGKWLVSEIRRGLYSKMSTVTLLRPTKPLPEPPSQPTSGDTAAQGGILSAISANIPNVATTGTAEAAVLFALSKEGGPYVWGGTGPTGYDCSGLVQAAFREGAGVNLPRVSWQQFNFCRDGGGEISVAAAAGIRGAILERSPEVRGDSGHIAISLGTGDATIEAMGSAYGIRKGRIQGRLFNHGARVPGAAY